MTVKEKRLRRYAPIRVADFNGIGTNGQTSFSQKKMISFLSHSWVHWNNANLMTD